MKTIMKFFKNNPLFCISITVGLIALLWKYSAAFKRTAKNLIKPMNWISPLQIKTWITSPFGKRGSEFHNGVDLHAPMGTAVIAPFDGVAFLSVNKDGGNQLVIQHDNGYHTGYAHLSKRMVSHGEKVKQGQLVAATGNSGAHTTAAHLHFTVTDKTGKKVNPLEVFNFPLKA